MCTHIHSCTDGKACVDSAKKVLMREFDCRLKELLANGNRGGGGRIPDVMAWLKDNGEEGHRGGGVCIMFPEGM